MRETGGDDHRHSRQFQPFRLTVRRTLAVAAVFLLAIIAVAGLAHAQTGGPNETPTRQGKLTKPPKLVQFVEATYPESEKLAERTASVIVQIAISDKGVVDDVAVVQSRPSRSSSSKLPRSTASPRRLRSRTSTTSSSRKSRSVQSSTSRGRSPIARRRSRSRGSKSRSRTSARR